MGCKTEYVLAISWNEARFNVNTRMTQRIAVTTDDCFMVCIDELLIGCLDSMRRKCEDSLCEWVYGDR